MITKFNSSDTWRLLDAAQESRGLFLFTFSSCKVVCRALSISEAESIARLAAYLTEAFIEDWVVQKTIISCTKGIDYILTNSKAGYAKTIANAVMDKSSISDEESLHAIIEESRNKSKTTPKIIEGLILSNFPSIDLFSVRSMTLYDQIDFVCRAETILGKPLLQETKEVKRQKAVEKVRRPHVESEDDFTQWLLSPEAADRPDFEKDNEHING